MNGGIWNRERAYRRRLYILTPVAAVLMVLLFLTSDRFPYREIEKYVGWEGEMRLMPEITIVPDKEDITSEERRMRLESMTSIDLDLAEVPNREEASPGNEDDRKQEEVAVPELDRFDVRTVQAARDVPYSEDYVILHMVEPDYPSEELKDGIEGNVTVELFVNEAGRVEAATVLSAVGPRSFQDASLDAVRQFMFQPPTENGEPRPMWIKFRIKFRIFG
jgi:TonB family protein